MTDITALGELLIDFTEAGRSENGGRLFEQNPGGAPANVLCAMSKLGASTQFIGKVGSDAHGLFLKETLERAKVGVENLVLADDVFTTLAFVSLSDTGDRTFSFARKPGADTCLRTDEISPALLSSTRILHVGSLSLTDEPARSATLYAVREAKRAGALISYDPNYRAPLWKSEGEAREQMHLLLPHVDLLKLSDEEAELLCGIKDPEGAARALASSGIRCVAVTLGGSGALICVMDETRLVPAFSVPVVDTTGAGDAFWGGFLFHLLALGLPEEIMPDTAEACAKWGAATAALCVGKRGAIFAMPTLEEVNRLINL